MKKAFCLMFAVYALLVLASCGKQEEIPPPESTPSPFDINEVSFTKSQVMLSEGHDSVGAPYGLNKTLETCEYEGVTYAFEPQVSYEDRAECIKVTDAVINRVGIGKKIGVNIYTNSTYDRTFTENGVVFTHVQDWKTPEYTVSLLYGLLGDYCHYGTLYGYANYLRGELFDTEFPACEVIPQFEWKDNFLDLNALCFRSEFVLENEIEQAKTLANGFVHEFIAGYGEAELLQLSQSSGTVEGNMEFRKALSDFYSAKGIDYTPTDILYRPGGRGYDYIVKCPYAVMYIEKDWFDRNKDMCPYTYDNFLHENYDDVKQYFSINIKEFEQYRELFGLYPYKDDLNIYFTNHYGQSSYYLARIHAVVAQNTASLCHEYIHSLTNEHNIIEPWSGEGFARYFSYYYNYYGNAMSTVDYNTTELKYILEYKNNLGRNIDMSTDYPELFHLMAYCNSFDDPNDGDGYVAGASFIDYLISRFGEEKVLDIICVTHDFGEYRYEELVTEWQTFLEENYSQYSKIK